ncbi:MAG TPA: MBL fold metallo-hydrolase [Solirubrobacteraceae bacterium]|nr:MBL fold metallo-hydrolase [Solirubrobacteraceae bacterium]
MQANGRAQGAATTTTVAWFGHATVLIEIDGVRLLTDPVLGRRVGPLVRVAPAAPAHGHLDAVLLSHLHADHADLASLRRVARGTPILAPRGAAPWLERRALGPVNELDVGASVSFGEVRVEATDARHDGQRWRYGHRAGCVGFLVRGSTTVYFAGDTDLFPAMAELAGHVDVALLPVAGWGPSVGHGHLDAERAARAASIIRPRVAIPIHWGTLALPAPLRRRAPDAGAEFAAHAARLAPGVEVRVLHAGERTELAP